MFKPKNECQRLEGMLSPYIDGQLSPGERERLEGHLQGCEGCRRELESLQQTVGLLQRIESAPIPRSFALAQGAPARRPTAFGALRVATAVAALALTFVFVGDAFDPYEGIALSRAGEEMNYDVGVDASSFAPQDKNESDLDEGLYPSEAGAGDEGGWPLRELELALVGALAVLGGATLILWQRRRRYG